ncbi:MAG: RNA polymerase sigma factor [Pseudomonadota bacterium]|nr:RNA polymerase sigma factor [Pseudomonadota bacterium]
MARLSAIAMFDGRGMDDDTAAGESLASGRAALPAGEPDDAELIARVGRGDRPAARLLMSRNLPRILGLARRMLNDEMEAEDIAQETFIRVWKAAPRWQAGSARVSTWMCRIAINLCYDRLRRRREVVTDTPPEQVDETPDAETAMTRAQSGDRIAAAMAQLPDRQRQALELVHFQDMSNIDAADIMSVSVEAVESLLARGRRKLKAILTGDAPDLMASYTGQRDARYGATQ